VSPRVRHRPATSPMLKLKRLKIHELPRVRSGTEMVFNDGVNVLLGLNGAGKTTLLLLLTYVISGRFEQLRDVRFHIEYEMVDGSDTYCVTVRHNPASQPLRSDQAQTYVELKRFRGERLLDRMTIEAGKLRITRDGATEEFDRHLDLMYPLAIYLVPLDAPTSPVRDVQRLDESIFWLAEVTDQAVFTSIEPYSGALVFASPFEVFIGELLRGREDKDLHRFTADDLPFLRAFTETLGLATATFQFELRGRERVEPHEFWQYKFADFRFRLEKTDGTRLSHHELSFGQQRILAFFYYAAMHPDIIIADELTNGMHHAMIERCLDEIGERQAFMATQSPLLLDHLPTQIVSAADARSIFIICSTLVEDGHEHLSWRNMSDEEATHFFRDLQVGISHVNEILRSRGMW